MNHMFAVLVASMFAAGAQASTLTITFDEPDGVFSSVDCGQAGTCQVYEIDGYRVTAYGFQETEPGDMRAFSVTFDTFGGPEPWFVGIDRIDGGEFSILEIGEYYGATDISSIGNGGYVNITQASFWSEYAAYAPVYLDDIVVSAVPIPAAVWLFGSALAGLGWMRRKQTT
jgi:hypothetical protein